MVKVAPKSDDTAASSTSGENELKSVVASHVAYSLGGLIDVSTKSDGSSSVLYPAPAIVCVAAAAVHATPSAEHSVWAGPNVCPPSLDT